MRGLGKAGLCCADGWHSYMPIAKELSDFGHRLCLLKLLMIYLNCLIAAVVSC